LLISSSSRFVTFAINVLNFCQTSCSEANCRQLFQLRADTLRFVEQLGCRTLRHRG
jgi:hypothetical protein